MECKSVQAEPEYASILAHLNKSNKVWNLLNEALEKWPKFHPKLSALLPLSQGKGQTMDPAKICSKHRDAVVSNLRFLHVYYGFGAHTFAMAVNILDRFLCKIKAHVKYLPCIATTCYYIAVKTMEESEDIPCISELLMYNQCNCTVSDLVRMERLILNKLNWDLCSVTATHFLEYFCAILQRQFPNMEVLNIEKLTIQMDILMCHMTFSEFSPAGLALALLAHALQESMPKDVMDVINFIFDLQTHCKVTDCEFVQCRDMILEYSVLHYTQSKQQPRPQLIWTVSRKMLMLLNPSKKVYTVLSPIEESDDSADDADVSDSESSDDNCSNSLEGSPNDPNLSSGKFYFYTTPVKHSGNSDSPTTVPSVPVRSTNSCMPIIECGSATDQCPIIDKCLETNLNFKNLKICSHGTS
ncbi:unnamed protein product [Owenia fusiformis]|uniref:Uncharacterized protein n=1 Tax=Owenia fusiformis TaxID=6347 RepID=A0A8J1TH12_OWEFU|nr:unnamed protein product [Owenia fusiformis]